MPNQTSGKPDRGLGFRQAFATPGSSATHPKSNKSELLTLHRIDDGPNRTKRYRFDGEQQVYTDKGSSLELRLARETGLSRPFGSQQWRMINDSSGTP